MLRAKAQLVARQGLSRAERALSIPQVVGQWGTYLAPLSNHLPQNGLFRAALERLVGLDRRAVWPRFARPSFRTWLARRKVPGGKTIQNPTSEPQNRRVAYFVGCHTDFYDTAVGKAAVTVLDRTGADIVAPSYRCCGMPQLAVGDMAGAEENARRNIAAWSRLVAEGYEVVTTCSTCALMLRQMYVELWPSEESRLLAAHSHDLFSYLAGLPDRGTKGIERGALSEQVHAMRSTQSKAQNAKSKINVLYHYSCHARPQRYGYHVVDTLRLLTGWEVDFAPTACCGQGGAYGFKAGAYEASLETGATLLDQLAEQDPDIVVTDCPMCEHRLATVGKWEVCHPVELLL
jgi:glycerol-3-phosphate dehydrogenase subunit C